MENHTILLNNTCILSNIQYDIAQYSMGFQVINITQLDVILSITSKLI